ncbi:hypothetical protein, partial [Phocaeicola plebeius]|uniref:hypothetical protein n=1 Tax=Phocaeicola plebeius TaxID=310297 RepID=UPI00266C0967
HSTKVFILFETAKPKAKKQCFTTYINYQDEIFKGVNNKVKKSFGIIQKTFSLFFQNSKIRIHILPHFP